ncbi:MAG: PQQ-dependent sugar dehydrogenase [Betaproteobacteria bacterium]
MHATDLLPGRKFFFSVLAIALLVAACGGGGDGGATPPVALRLERIDSPSLAFGFPVFLTAPPGDTARLFVVEKGGLIKAVNKATNSLIGTFLDISVLVSTGGEQGLLGLAFDPNYAINRRFYVSYTDTSGSSVIARYLADQNNPNLAVGTVDRIILTLVQPFSNHNGGMIAFGPDGMLYIGFGDGGGGGDPDGHAQDPTDLLGKLLRIDVSRSTAPQPAYTIASDNPFAAAALGKEIWSLGLRNPWRYSFDRQTGDLYIADVGQGNWEEVDVATLASGGGRGINYGWKVMEGNHCFSPNAGCDMTGLTLPLLEYDHGNGCSITGGYAYRGVAIPGLEGTYFYGDFCAGFVRSFRLVNGTATEAFDWTALRPGGNITSFGEDGSGELYILTSGGGLYRIAQA